MPSSQSLGAGFKFQCIDEQGAVLIMKHPANRDEIIRNWQMPTYMAQNIDSWHDFIVTKLGADVAKGSIRVICGTYKTID